MVTADWRLRLRSLFNRRVVERELDEELQFHLAQQAAAYQRQGHTAADARRRAHLEFGGVAQIHEEHRDSRGVGLVVDLGRDVAYAVRQMRRTPGFAAVAVLCLGLGVGVNTSIFGVLSAFLLRPLPVWQADRVVRVSRGADAGLAFDEYEYLRTAVSALSGLTASFPMESDLEVGGESQFVSAEVVAGNYATVLGLRTTIGDWFTNETDPVAVISHAVWQRRFNARPDVVGQRIGSESQSYTVVGVAPREFGGIFGPLRTDIWVPLRTRISIAAYLTDGRPRRMLMFFGRLADGATRAQASTALNAADVQRRAQSASSSDAIAPLVARGVSGVQNEGLRRVLATVMTLLTAAVGVILLIACANVGNMLLARGTARQRELGIRNALGASRGRLVRQLLAESLVLAAGGAVSGTVLAYWSHVLLVRSMPSLPSLFPVQLDLSLDWRLIAFAMTIALIATMACGVIPAWRLSRSTPIALFRGKASARRSTRRSAVVVSQVALSLVLLMVAAALVESLLRLQTIDPGFTTRGRLYAYAFVPNPAGDAGASRAFYAEALNRIRGVPGIEQASLTTVLPLMPAGSNCVSLAAASSTQATVSAVDPGYFSTLGIGIVEGRDFSVGDDTRGDEPVIVNQALADRIAPRASAIDQSIAIGCDRPTGGVVVGVVRNSAIRNLGEEPRPHVYRFWRRQGASGLTTFVVESRIDAASVREPLRRTLVAMGRGVRVYAVEPIDTYLAQSLFPMRWLTSIVGVFGVVALVLAAVGLYGVTAYRVSQGTQEIGVRMALGATRPAIFKDVVAGGLAPVLLGIAFGEILAVPLIRIVSSAQEGIHPVPIVTGVGIAVMWTAASLVACYIPASRASRVDPLVALRHD